MAVGRIWASVIGVAALAAATVAVAGPATAGRATQHHFPVINYHPRPDVGNRPIPQLAGGLATFTASQADHGSTFKFTMVGKNPRVTQSAPATTVQAELIPIDFVRGGVSNDPTVGNTCDSTPVTTRTMNSPIVKSVGWKFGGTAIGTGQYTDAFQRAEFWKFASPTGINPGYHVNLNWTQLPKVTVTVPKSESTPFASPCQRLLGVDVNWLDADLQNTVLPSLTSQGLISPKKFPMFVASNVVEYDTIPTNCCILGYHNAMNTTSGIQTYGISDYDGTGEFDNGTPLDVAIASHEVAEWMDDPTGVNPTKPWGNIGQVSGCQSNLEVGDPLSGTLFTRRMNGFTYHLQELAFFSWFYHQSPSIGVHGWYSDQGSFTTSAAPCP
jgi:hypothetical protein